MASKLEQEVAVWRGRTEDAPKWVLMKILWNVLNNADIAMRQRDQYLIKVTIAADLEEYLVGKALKVANEGYATAAKEMRHLNGRVSRVLSQETVGAMKFDILKIHVDLTNVELASVQRRLREVRAQLGRTRKKPTIRRHK